MEPKSGPAAAGACAFCDRESLDEMLFETGHFYVLADHAPLVEGHLLIIPKTHFACYGALPGELESEFRSVKREVREFLASAYRQPVFFEHGIFRQTVFHAHLHAMPFGPIELDLHSLITQRDSRVASLADVREWYHARGPYFYLERPDGDAMPRQAAIFAPDEPHYYRVLGALRNATNQLTPWLPPAVRRIRGRDAMHTVALRWRERAKEVS